MAIPVLLPILTSVSNAMRFPAIMAFLGGLATKIFDFFFLKFTKNVAINLTIVTMIIGLAYAVSFAIYTLLTGISFVVPSYINQAWGFFVPDIAVPCVSTIYSARIMRWVWVWKIFVITKISGV